MGVSSYELKVYKVHKVSVFACLTAVRRGMKRSEMTKSPKGWSASGWQS